MEGILKRKTAALLVYTREPKPGTIPCGLAYAVHLAVCRDGRSYEPLNQNYGVLFAPADVTPDNHARHEEPEKPLCVPPCGRRLGHRSHPHAGNGRTRPCLPRAGVENERFYDIHGA